MEITEPIKAKAAGPGKGQTALYMSLDNEEEYTKKMKPDTKEYNILKVLADGRSLNRFEAIRLHDTALNSTISTLQQKTGLYIDRKTERVPCVHGTKMATVCRYWLPESELPKARRLLGLPEVMEAAA
jgi:hypothetical protein